MARGSKAKRRFNLRRRKVLPNTTSNIPRVTHSISQVPLPTNTDRTLFVRVPIRIHLHNTAKGDDNTLEFNGLGSAAIAIWSFQVRDTTSGSINGALSFENFAKLALTKSIYCDTNVDNFDKSALWTRLCVSLKSAKLSLIDKGSNEDFTTGYLMLDPGEHVPGTTGNCHSGRSATSSVAIHTRNDLWYNATVLNNKLRHALYVRLISNSVLSRLVPKDVNNPKDFAYLEVVVGLRFTANNDVTANIRSTTMVNKGSAEKHGFHDWL